MGSLTARLRLAGIRPTIGGLRSGWIRVRASIRDWSEKTAVSTSRPVGPTVEERREELLEFYERYEQFVETLCDAAQFGSDERLAAAYGRLRDWLSQRYEPLRPFVSAYMPPDTAVTFRLERGRAPDATEELFSNKTLEEFLRNDDGGMIQRITCTREALNLYGQHLRQLASQSA